MSPAEEAMTVGQAIWKKTYAKGTSDDEALSFIQNLDLKTDHFYHQAELNFIRFTAKWADSGYPQLVTGHKYAAALMATKLQEEFAEDLHLPGSAFLISVPDRLLSTERDVPGAKVRRVNFDQIMIATFDYSDSENNRAIMLLRESKFNQWQMTGNDSLANILFDDIEMNGEFAFERKTSLKIDPSGETRHSAGRRPYLENIFLLARRLVAGLLLAMRSADNFQDRIHQKKKPKNGHRGLPEHRIFTVGKPITIDCRPAIATFLGDGTGRGNPPNVQTLVRGHHKRQPMGPQQSERKIIWIEPYWRGPEDAVILSRPLCFAGREEM